MARTRRSRRPRSPYYHFLLRQRTRSPLLLRAHPLASQFMDHRKQQRSSGSAAKNGGGKGSGKAGGGGKKPIKVVYISNPMRVKTNAAGFRALVQQLTGRHADPSKYSADDEYAAAQPQQELSPEGSAAASTLDAVAPGPAAAPEFAAGAYGDGEGDDEGEDDDIFGSQLLDTDYAILSPPPLLFDYPHGSISKIMDSDREVMMNMFMGVGSQHQRQ